MNPSPPTTNSSSATAWIGAKVRELRLRRQWTQAQLAKRLGLSQGRLSELERGLGSFSAEQLLLLLQLFNVDVAEFQEAPHDDSTQLQNALARLGAFHLRESPDVLVGDRLRRASDVIRAVLLQPTSERHLTALAPVLVWSVDDVALPALQRALSEAGVPNRLGWLAENVLEAVTSQASLLREGSPWTLRLKAAGVVLSAYLEHLQPMGELPDRLDRGIRSRKTWEAVWDEASAISKRWRIISALTSEDFGSALGESIALR